MKLIDLLLTSPLPARSKLAGYLNLFDPTQRRGEGKQAFLSFSRDSEQAYAADDLTGAMYRFRSDNVDGLGRLLAEGNSGRGICFPRDQPVNGEDNDCRA